jgi:two-component system, LytTR family, response regulator
MVLQALLVDDEPFARADLRALLAGVDGVQIGWEAGSLEEARAVLASHQPDVVFLDVQLPEGSGFDLMPHIPEPTQVVFVTAYDRYALRAFEVNALDYLLKPVSADRFATCLERLWQRHGMDVARTPPPSQVKLDDRMLIKSGSHREFIAVDHVVAVTSMGGNYTQLCKTDGSWLDVRRTIKEWEDILPEIPFVRVHRAAIVNIHHVEELDRQASGGLRLRIKYISSPLTVSRRQAHRIEELLKHKGPLLGAGAAVHRG